LLCSLLGLTDLVVVDTGPTSDDRSPGESWLFNADFHHHRYWIDNQDNYTKAFTDVVVNAAVELVLPFTSCPFAGYQNTEFYGRFT
jgi:GT2 family glycosyltransferase